MKKFYLIACAALCASMAMAAPSLPKSSITPFQKKDLVRTTPSKHSATRAEDYTVLTEVPGTQEIKNYNCTYYSYYSGSFYNADSPNYISIDGNDVYMQDIVGGASLGSWVKGTKEGNTITVPVPQAMFYQTVYNEYVLLCGMKSDGEGGFVYDPEVTELTFDINPDGSWSLDLGNSLDETDPENVIGFVWSSDMTWVDGYAEAWLEISEPLYEREPIPADVQLEKWALVDTYYADFCEVGIQGDNVYIKGLYPDYPEAYVQGTIDGETIVFEPQYMGAGSGYYLFFCPYTVDSDGYPDVKLDKVYASYSAADKIIEADEGELWFACPAEEGVDSGYVDYLEDVLFFYETPEDMDAAPVDPVFYTYMEYDPTYGYGGIAWMMAPLNVNGYVLDPNNLYVNLFLNGKPMPLTPEITGLAEDMYDIPCGYCSPSGDYVSYSTQVVYYIPEPFEVEVKSLGCQIIYKGSDGETYKSNLVTEEVAGVDEIANKDVKSESFVDFTGMSITKPERGMYIKTTVFSDGTRKAEKVVVR